MGDYDKHAAIICGHTPAGLICLWFSTRSGYSMYKHAGLALCGFCDGLEPPENCILRIVGVFASLWVVFVCIFRGSRFFACRVC